MATRPGEMDWTSGFALAADADLLIHDTQYTDQEYSNHVGWGHRSFDQAFAFAAVARAKRLVTFHHDPNHTDAMLDRLTGDAVRTMGCRFEAIPGVEVASFRV